MARSRIQPDETPEENGGADREEAQRRFDEAQEALQQAQQEAAEAGQGLAATVTQNIPEMGVEVLPGNSVSHNNEVYYGEGYPLAPEGHEGGDRLTLDGPTALALLQAGTVRITGEAGT
jgi:hypothetical protein